MKSLKALLKVISSAEALSPRKLKATSEGVDAVPSSVLHDFLLSTAGSGTGCTKKRTGGLGTRFSLRLMLLVRGWIASPFSKLGFGGDAIMLAGILSLLGSDGPSWFKVSLTEEVFVPSTASVAALFPPIVKAANF